MDICRTNCSTSDRRRKARRQAFSVIELLVVVAIVAVLSGLLLSAIAGIREASVRVDCASRLRQCGMSLLAIANDHRGQIPPGHPNETYVPCCFNQTSTWERSLGGILPDYCENTRIFTCSTYGSLLRNGAIKTIDSQPRLADGTIIGQDAYYFTFSYFPGRSLPAVYPSGTSRTPLRVNGGNGRWIMMSDVLRQNIFAAGEFFSAPVPAGTAFIGNHGRGFGPPTATHGEWSNTQRWAQAARFSPVLPGDSGGNSLLSDGSVQWRGHGGLKAYAPGSAWNDTVWAFDLAQ